MKNLILLVALTTTCTFTFAQAGSSFGIKGGLNYNANGDYFESIGETVEDPSRNIGYHIGLFGKIGNTLYFRPEVVYTTTKSEYDSGDFDMKKIDVPLLVGIKLLGPLSVFGGPSLQYILDSEFVGVSIENVDYGIGTHIMEIKYNLEDKFKDYQLTDIFIEKVEQQIRTKPEFYF